MVKFKVIISNKNGKSETIEVEGVKAYPLIGKSIGDTVDGTILGLKFKKLLITGGTDKDGFPMKPDVHGGVKAKLLLSESVGFHPRFEGERRKKTVRGRIITDDIVQVNMKVLEE
ncbi:MAG: 30S ribosomal protein S6e [Candidatus Bathyarchaeota archaeon]